MKKVFFLATILAVIGWIIGAFASEFGTEEEAKAMVKKAIAYVKEVGKEKALAEFSNTKGKFIDRDLYIFVYDMNGVVLAHGQNPKLVGKNLYNVKDADGKEYVKERIELIKAKGSGWQEYKFMNPVTKKIEQKKAYVERYEDMIIGCGAYPKK
ncbi:MAG: cache domain-containing protein [Deltaproteobacteria bacterium]|nr:cache domain-containing protein [Deltaproteobacteria bacterium]